ncbi:RHS repeat-associated core domain-containing protein, partial [Mucilaginibacter sp. Bleaf8]|uniref:RHS repeat-associated core domain-containing protein n=1 Tax=Mucilaginibacter sp. Bleaf8 TaxID=2834430 RepID=UPI001BCD2BDB
GNTPRIIQEDEYYSFGLRKPTGGYDLSNNNRYLYNGKEVQTDLANQYDYGARFYDPVIARWTTMDQKAEKFYPLSAYSYVANNPILLNDPNGMDWAITVDKDDKGVSHYHIAFTGAVLDRASDRNKHETRAYDLAQAVKRQFTKLFNSDHLAGKDGEAGFTVDARIEMREINDIDQLGSKESLFTIKDSNDFKDQDHPSAHILAQAMDGKNISVNVADVNDMISDNNGKTLPHEIGHTGGLRHPAQEYKIHFGGDGYKYRFLPGPTANQQGSHNFMI